MVKQFPNRARPNFSDILIRQLSDPDKEKKVRVTTKTPGTRWQPGIVILEDVEDFDNEIYEKFLAFMAQVYKSRVKEAIETQEFKRMWEPLSERYLDYKERAGLDKRHFIRSGQMLEAIRVRYFPQVNSYAVGIDATERFREILTVKNEAGRIIDHTIGGRTATKILYIARLLEYGTENMPSRKLWRPVRDILQRDINKYVRKFKREEGLN